MPTFTFTIRSDTDKAWLGILAADMKKAGYNIAQERDNEYNETAAGSLRGNGITRHGSRVWFTIHPDDAAFIRTRLAQIKILGGVAMTSDIMEVV